MVVAVILVFSGMNWFYGVILQKEFEFRRRFVVQVVRSVAFSGVALTLGFLGAGVWSLVLGYLAGHLANGVALFVLAPYRVRLSQRSRVRDIVRGGPRVPGTGVRGVLRAERGVHLDRPSPRLNPARLASRWPSVRVSCPISRSPTPSGRLRSPPLPACDKRAKTSSSRFSPRFAWCACSAVVGDHRSAGPAPFTLALFGPNWLPMTGRPDRHRESGRSYARSRRRLAGS